MDFSRYSRIDSVYKGPNGFKKTFINKNRIVSAERSWEQFSDEELKKIDEEILTAPKVYSNIITSVAIIWNNSHTFMAIPVKDVLWIYNRVFVSKMNFIPYNKEHSLMLLSKNGEEYNLGSTNIGGFSKKQPNDANIEILKNALSPYRKGIIYGYSNEIASLFANDFEKAIEIVDKNSEV